MWELFGRCGSCVAGVAGVWQVWELCGRCGSYVAGVGGIIWRGFKYVSSKGKDQGGVSKYRRREGTGMQEQGSEERGVSVIKSWIQRVGRMP